MILSKEDLERELKSGAISITPLDKDTIRENGVDLRLADEVARLKHVDHTSFDITFPKSDEFYQMEKCEDSLLIYPYEKILVSTHERIRLPNNLMAFCQLRSTFARVGILIPPTVVDAGFSGNLTIQLSGSSFPVKIPVKTRFLHLIFAEMQSSSQNGYRGKYQDSNGVSLPSK